MWLEFIGDIFDVLGKIMIAMTALAVHDTVMKKHALDDEVDKTIRKEHIYAFAGIALLVTGFALRQIGKYLA